MTYGFGLQTQRLHCTVLKLFPLHGRGKPILIWIGIPNHYCFGTGIYTRIRIRVRVQQCTVIYCIQHSLHISNIYF